MQSKKAKALAHMSAKQKMLVSLISLFLFACATFYAQNTLAETNVAGVEIEIIDEPVAVASKNDAVQDLVIDIESNEQADAQGDLWARIREGYAIADIESPLTSKHETWYASRPDYIKRMTERSQKYLFHIVEEVQRRGMPTEIALLPMIESAYNPQAYSRSKASGIWQFIPSTGKNYGLKQDWWVDNRRNVTAATDAALDYLQKLHGMFGSWDLALAAYNAGEGTVQRAINKNRKLGLATNYQSLSLPPETRNYVPKLQAIKNIITDPEKYGLALNSIPNHAYFARVTTPKQIDAKLAAQLAEISYEEFSALNPSYNRPVITSTGEKHQLLLPVWAAENFATNLANYDKPLTSWQTYNAKRGERIDHIAQKFGTNVSHLRDVNDLPATKKLRKSQAVLVPAAYNAQATEDAEQTIDVAELENNHAIEQAEDEPKATRRVTHKVKKGETLSALADKYDTSPQALMKLNRLKSSKVKAGQNLKIKEGSKQTASSKSRKVASKSHYKKVSAHKRSIKSKRKSSGHISARSHIRLK
jgi:membrane-bound lytic murein transglycosylase D